MAPREMHNACPARRQFVFRQQSRSTLRRCRRSSPRNGRGYALEPPGAVRPGQRAIIKSRNAASRALFHIRFRSYSLLPAVAQFRAPFTT